MNQWLKRVLILAAVCSGMTHAATCESVFPDPVVSNDAGGHLRFNSKARVIGSDGILAASSITDYTKGTSCDRAKCNISGVPASKLSLAAFSYSTGSQNIQLNKPSQNKLAAGHYNTIRLNNRSSITTTTNNGTYYVNTLALNSHTSMYLTSGTYWINSLTLNSGTRLVLLPGANVTLYVNSFTMNSGSQVNQENDASPGKLLLISYGDTTFNSHTFINAHVYAVNEARYNSHATHVGAVSAAIVTMNSHAKVTGTGAALGELPGGVCSTQVTLPDPVGHWPFNVCSLTGDSGDVPDIAAGNHGSSENLPSIVSQGKYCQAGQFKGQGDFVSIPHARAYASADFSVSMWIYSDDLSFTNQSVNGGMALLSKDARGFNTGGDFSVFITESGNVRVIQQTASRSIQLQSPPIINEGQWHHVVYTAGRSGVVLYVDNTQVASDTGHTSGMAGNQAFTVLGAYAGNTDGEAINSASLSDYFNGSIDDVRYYDEQLSAEMISQLYNLSQTNCQTCQSSAFNIAHWDFDVCSVDGQSGTVVDVKNGINGVTGGQVAVNENGRFCQALDFDGRSYVSVDNHHAFAIAEGSLTFWLYIDSLDGDPATRQTIIAKDGGNTRTDGQFTAMVDGQGSLVVRLVDNGQSEMISVAQSLTATQWHHVVFQWSSTDILIYVDGVQQTRTTTSYSWQHNTQPMLFGASGDALPGNSLNASLLTQFFTGDLDDIKLYSGVLSSAEIQALFNASDYGCASCSGKDPMAHYLFEALEWPGSNSIQDTSDYANHGSPLGDVASALPDNPVSCRVLSVPDNRTSTIAGMDTGIDFNAIGSKGTISFWYRANEDWQSGNSRMLFDVSSDGFYGYIDANGRIRIAIEDVSLNRFSLHSDIMSFAAEDWVHIAVTWNLPAKEVGLLIDGQARSLYGSTHSMSTAIRDVGTLKFGDFTARSGEFYGTLNSANGAFDDVRLYRYVLSQDEVTGDMEAVTPCSGVHHFAITHPTQALTCEGATVEIKACADETCSELFADALDVQVALRSGEDIQAFTLMGEASLQLNSKFEGEDSVLISSAQGGSQPANDTQCTDNCVISFVDAGFQFYDTTQPYQTQLSPVVAGSAFDSVGLRAVQNNNGVCQALLTGEQRLTLGMDCLSPVDATYSQDVCQVALSNVPLQGDGSGQSKAAVTLTFNDDGETTLAEFVYQDVGRVQLTASTSIDGKQINSGEVVLNSIPASLRVDAATQSPHVAGTGFNYTVTALDIAGQPVPGYQPGQLQGRLTRVALLHADAVDAQLVLEGNVSVTSSDSEAWADWSAIAFTQGVYQTNEAFVEEVGSYQTAVQDSNYLGSVITSNSVSLGRIIPAYFDVELVNDVRVAPACSGQFTYLGQHFGFELGAEPALRVTAYNAKNKLTKNYADALWALFPTSNQLADIAYHSSADYSAGVNVDVAGNRPLVTNISDYNGNGEIWFTGAMLAYQKVSTPSVSSGGGSPFEASVTIEYPSSILTDRDGVCYQRQYPQDCQSFSIESVTGSEMRYGRLRLDNTYGPETETLRMPILAEYYQDGQWMLNDEDSCTSVALSQARGELVLENASTGNSEADITGLLSGIAGSGLLTNGESDDNTLAVGPALSDGVAVKGAVSIRLAPSAQGADWARHLNIDWDGDGDIDNDDSPEAELYLGIYRGNDRTIHMREGF